MEEIQLYSYFRSSASYRVRIALNFKSLPYTYTPVHLINAGGEQHQESFRKLNPMGEVPCLVHKGRAISQSMAIIQYIDSLVESPPLLPSDPYKKSKVIEICEVINSGIHPLQNLKVLQKLERQHNLNEEERSKWAAYWIVRGFESLEHLLVPLHGTYSFGDTISMADLFVCPQVYNARRYNVDMSIFPTIESIEKNCLTLEAFRNAYPGVQPDTPND